MCWLVSFFCYFIQNPPGCTLLFCFLSVILNGMYPRILSTFFSWIKTHGYCGIEYGEWVKHIWEFGRCCDNIHFRRVCMSILDWFSSNVNEEVVVLGRIIDALGPNAHVVSVHGGPHSLVEAYGSSWAVDISKSWLSIRCLTCVLSNDALNALRQVSLELWTPTQWWSSLWNGWRGQRVVIGRLVDQHWKKGHHEQQYRHARTRWRRGQ